MTIAVTPSQQPVLLLESTDVCRFDYFQSGDIFFVRQITGTYFAQNLANDSNMVVLVFITVDGKKQSEVVGMDGQPLGRRTVEREKDNAIQEIADRMVLYDGRRKKG